MRTEEELVRKRQNRFIINEREEKGPESPTSWFIWKNVNVLDSFLVDKVIASNTYPKHKLFNRCL